MQRFCASGLLLALGSAAADPQGYAVPQYDLMDMMVRDVPYEEVGEEPRRDEADNHVNLMPLAQLYRALDGKGKRDGHFLAGGVGGACPATLQHNERMLITLNVLAYHGSSALHQALMSSSKVATMCSGNQWQCEVALGKGSRCPECQSLMSHTRASATKKDEQFARAIEKGRVSPATRASDSGLPCFACAGDKEEKQGIPCEKRSMEQKMSSDLRLFEPYWESQANRTIMVVKWAPFGGACPLMKDMDPHYGGNRASSGIPELPSGEVRGPFGAEVLTSRMRASGVSRLHWATVFMHRPWCMWRASSHTSSTGQLGRGEDEQSISTWARRELMKIEGLVQQHQKLAHRGASVIVVSMAQLIFSWDKFSGRLHSFAPCLEGQLDPQFEPQLGADIFLTNQVKTGGTLRDFARLHSPPEWKLSASELRCTEKPEVLYEGLNATEMVRAQAAEEYLLGLSEASPDSLQAAQVRLEATMLEKIKSVYDELSAAEDAKQDEQNALLEAKGQALAAAAEGRSAKRVRANAKHQLLHAEKEATAAAKALAQAEEEGVPAAVEAARKRAAQADEAAAAAADGAAKAEAAVQDAYDALAAIDSKAPAATDSKVPMATDSKAPATTSKAPAATDSKAPAAATSKEELSPVARKRKAVRHEAVAAKEKSAPAPAPAARTKAPAAADTKAQAAAHAEDMARQKEKIAGRAAKREVQEARRSLTPA